MIKNFKDGLRVKRRGKRLKLFHATDFQSLMYPNFLLSKILGIFPYRIKASSFKLSKPCYILWTIIFCAICIYQLILLYKLNFSGIKSDTPTIISLNFSLTYGIFIMAVSYIFTGPRMRLLQTISDISLRLPQQLYYKLSKLIHVKDIFGFFFLFCLISLNPIRNTVYRTNIIFDARLEIFRLYMTLMAFQTDMLYVNCVCVLKACFKEVNDNLEDLREIVMNNIPTWTYVQRYPFLMMKLKVLKKQHLMISNTVQILNVIFSLHLLATVVICFKQIIFTVYFHVVQWENGIFFNLNTIHDAYFISFLTYYLIKITLIVWVCETGKNQAIKIGTIIHDVLNSTNDVQIKDELQLFSLQILHCKNTFSAKGFTVNAMLFTAMVSGITTYLLILIQFLIMSHSCDGKKNAINYMEAT